MSYDPPCIAVEPRVPGFHDVRCRPAWTPCGVGKPQFSRILGDCLDADGPAGMVFLGDGIESALHDLVPR